uniref:Kazal-like domain-containing protein n=1 Tax=Gongylonema pulchrum TaxID=637853 RepID=A0A183DGX4_9BILA
LEISLNIFLAQTAIHKDELNQEIRRRYGDFKEDCFPKPSGGCRCNEKDAAGNVVVRRYDDEKQCKIPEVNRYLCSGAVLDRNGAVEKANSVVQGNGILLMVPVCLSQLFDPINWCLSSVSVQTRFYVECSGLRAPDPA